MNHHATVFYKKLKELHPKIRALSPYVDSRTTPMEFKCLTCGHEWANKPGQVVGQRKAGCPKCMQARVQNLALATKREAQQRKVIGWLRGSPTSIVERVDPVTFKLKCNTCGRSWDAHVNSIRKYVRTGCRKCTSKAVGLETKAATIRRILESDHRFTHLELLSGATEVRCQCAKCGSMWETSIGSLKKGSACKACATRRMLSSPRRNPKTIKIRGKVFHCTGYEPQAIDYLVTECHVPAREISTDVPSFNYTYAGLKRTYTPDLIAGGRYVIEVKSEFSFGVYGAAFDVNVLAMNKAKCRCVQRAGYDFRMIVVRVTGRHRNNVSVTMLPVGWERIPARDLRKLVVSNLHNVIRS